MAVPGLTLRPFQPSDFETLLIIDQACFPKGIAYGRTELRSYLGSPDSYCIVSEISGSIAGFIVTDASGEYAHVITLDVLKPYRRQSIGSLLLSAAEQEACARGAGFMYLETATTNEVAIALWKKHGYRETGVIENYYGSGQDAFEMQKQLAPKISS